MYPVPEVTLPLESTVAALSFLPSPLVSTESPRIPSPSGSKNPASITSRHPSLSESGSNELGIPSPSRSSINSSVSRIPSLSSSSSKRSWIPSLSLSGNAISLAFSVVSFSPHENPGVLKIALNRLLFIVVDTGSIVREALLVPENAPSSLISVQVPPLSSLTCHWYAIGDIAVPDVVNVSDLPSEETTLDGFVIEVNGPPASWKSYTPLSSLSYPSVTP